MAAMRRKALSVVGLAVSEVSSRRTLEAGALAERTLGDPLLLAGPLQDAQQGVAGAECLDSPGVLGTLGLGEQRVERSHPAQHQIDEQLTSRAWSTPSVGRRVLCRCAQRELSRAGVSTGL